MAKNVEKTRTRHHHSAHSELKKLGLKRLDQFLSLFPRVLVNDDPEIIHDVRVGSRRLQQTLRMLFPKPRSNAQRRVLTELREIRKRLGDWRNLDVCLENISKKLNTDRPHMADWTNVYQSLKDDRGVAIHHARRKLKHFSVGYLGTDTFQLIKASHQQPEALNALDKNVARYRAEWLASLDAAKTQMTVKTLHSCRVAGKKWRYAAELSHQLGAGASAELVAALKALQDDFGAWHDQEMLTSLLKNFVKKLDATKDRDKNMLAAVINQETRGSTNRLKKLIASADSFAQRHAIGG